MKSACKDTTFLRHMQIYFAKKINPTGRNGRIKDEYTLTIYLRTFTFLPKLYPTRMAGSIVAVSWASDAW